MGPSDRTDVDPMSYPIHSTKPGAGSAPGTIASLTRRSNDWRAGRPDGAFEQEAERVADAIMQGNTREQSWSLSRASLEAPVQKKCACGGGGRGGEEGGE